MTVKKSILFTWWLIGPSASGKSSIAKKLYNKMHKDVPNLIIIDAHLSKNLLAEINIKLTNLLDGFQWEGTETVTIESGTIGKHARALGSAIIPFNSLYGLSQSTLLKKY